MNKIDSAIQFALNAHKGQYRKGRFSLPYIVHPIEVMKRVSLYTMEEDILIASVLHDVVEDSGITLEEIASAFNITVANIVHECSRAEGDDANDLQKYEFMESFKGKSNASIMIKVADRLCNVMDYRRDPSKGLGYHRLYALEAFPLLKSAMQIQHIENGDLEKFRTDVNRLFGIADRSMSDTDLAYMSPEQVKRRVLELKSWVSRK